MSLCSVTQLCSTLCDPMDWSPTGSSVHGILQARVLSYKLDLIMYCLPWWVRWLSKDIGKDTKAATRWPMLWGFPGLQWRGKSDITDPELRDPGESSESERAWDPSPDQLPHKAKRTDDEQDPRQDLSPPSPATRLEPLHCLTRPLRGGLSFLKVIFTNGDGFGLLLLSTSLFYLKIAKYLNGSEKSMGPFTLQTKAIQVKPQMFRKTFPGKTVPVKGQS